MLTTLALFNILIVTIDLSTHIQLRLISHYNKFVKKDDVLSIGPIAMPEENKAKCQLHKPNEFSFNLLP